MEGEDSFNKSFDNFLATAANIRRDNRRLSKRFEEVLSASPQLRPAAVSPDNQDFITPPQ